MWFCYAGEAVRTSAVLLVLRQFEAGPALTRHATFRGLPADVSAAVILIHAVHPICGGGG